MLRVTSIFPSISGEVGSFPQGSIAQFVRFGGCNLKCKYCDTDHTQDMKSGQEMLIGDIAQILLDSSVRNLVLTGGEPLVQDHEELITLARILNGYNFKISIETNGTIDIPLPLRHYCSIVMDYKLDHPGRMDITRFLQLGSNDFIKFPIDTQMDLEEAVALHRRFYQSGCLAKFAYSPIFAPPGDSAAGFDQKACSEHSTAILNYLLKHNMDAVLNLQIHKIIQAE